MNPKEIKRFAVLIDADNISDDYIKTIMDEIVNFGVATIRRMYGDWTKEDKKGWKQTCLDYSITPIQQFENTSGKNSTDSAMIIDAMDILYANEVEGFCLCSSDSDFTRLAARLRESGKEVIGMGEKSKKPKALMSACETYKFLDVIKNEGQIDNFENLKKEILSIIDNSEMNGYALSSYIGTSLKRKHPEFDPRNYGCKKLLDLFEKLGLKTESVDETGGTIKVFAD